MRAWPLVALVLATACSRSGSPTIPSSSAAAPPVVSGASLSFSRVRATAVAAEGSNSYKFEYQVRFALAETSGKSGATIQNVETSIEDSFNTGPGCWRDTFRVAPSATLDVFDSGWTSLGYCAPEAASRSKADRVSLAVTFADDEGRTTTIYATALVTQ
jgi:hypothetical protein